MFTTRKGFWTRKNSLCSTSTDLLKRYFDVNSNEWVYSFSAQVFVKD